MTIQTEKEAFWYLPANRTPQMDEALVHFRAQLQSLGPEVLLPGHSDDVTLLRFLKARQWNVENATTMYRNMVAWRKEHKVDEIYESLDFPELKQLMPHYPHFYHKTDKYGRPVYIVLLGSMDCTKMLHVTTQERMLDYHVFTWERLERQLMPACSALKGHAVTTCTVILDLHGVSMKNFNATTRKLLHAITKIDQDFYPEHLGTMFIINAPMIFTAIWAVVNPLLEERTRKKIMLLGAHYHDTVAQLIPQENLLTIFGGTSVCKDHVHSEGPFATQPAFTARRWFPDNSAGAAGIGDSLAPAAASGGAALKLPDSPSSAVAADEAARKLAGGLSLTENSATSSAADMKITADVPLAPVVPVVPVAAAVAQ